MINYSTLQEKKPQTTQTHQTVICKLPTLSQSTTLSYGSKNTPSVSSKYTSDYADILNKKSARTTMEIRCRI